MIILDSSFLIAFKIRNDVHHAKADEIASQVAAGRFGKPLITNYIFDETATGIYVRSKNLSLAVEYGNELLTSVETHEVDDATFRRAWTIFSHQQQHGELSFTDCTTIAAMNLRDVGDRCHVRSGF